MELITKLKPVYYVKFNNGYEQRQDRLIETLEEIRRTDHSVFYLNDDHDVALLDWINSKLKDRWKNDSYEYSDERTMTIIYWDKLGWDRGYQYIFFGRLIDEIKTMKSEGIDL